MTLITYLSRVHFADGVLEVALNSELELNNRKRPLLVSEQNAVSHEFSERVIAGLPFWCETHTHQINQKEGTLYAISNLQKKIQDIAADVVVAFGSSLALSVADACCKGSHSTSEQCKSSVFTAPEFFAIPGVDGLPIMSMPRSSTKAGNKHLGTGIQPDTVVIDPTLIIGESTERTASAVANTMARCLSAHFSSAYNPPADGIAVEGFKRIVRNLSTISTEDTLEMRRDLMAASLSATLAMQKDSGIARELCVIIQRLTPQTINEGTLMRLLIVVEAELMEVHWSEHRQSEVRATLGAPADRTLSNWISSLMKQLALPASLAELGVGHPEIVKAASELAANRSALVPSAEQLINMLKTVKLQQTQVASLSEFA